MFFEILMEKKPYVKFGGNSELSKVNSIVTKSEEFSILINSIRLPFPLCICHGVLFPVCVVVNIVP